MFFTGAQDWYSMVNFDSPNLIYPLDCKFNRQMSKYNDEYSACHNKNTYDKDNTFIIHLNGNHQWKNFNDYLIESYIMTKLNIYCVKNVFFPLILQTAVLQIGITVASELILV